MQLRRTRPTDIDTIMSIIAQARASLAALGIDQWQGGYPHRGIIEADLSRGESYAVVENDENSPIIATVMVSFRGEPDYDVIDHGAWLTDGTSDCPCYGTIHRVAVDAACTGRGVASFLLAQAEEVARAGGRQSVRIDTHPGNEPMHRLLAKCGFTRCGTIYIAHVEEGSIPERIAYEKLLG